MTTHTEPSSAFIKAQTHDRSRRLIKTTGEVITYDKPQSMGEIHALIKADGIDTVSLHHLKHPLIVMAVVDRGYDTVAVKRPPNAEDPFQDITFIDLETVAALLPVNAIATALYHANCIPGTTHQIVGDVFICPDNDFARGGL